MWHAYAHGKLSKRTKAKCLQRLQKNKLAPPWPEYAESVPGILGIVVFDADDKAEELSQIYSR
jgi:hypothetical protein